MPRLGRKLTRDEAVDLYRRLAAKDPDPRTELEYTNPYTLLVAVVLSAQATDKGVNKATAPLFKKIDNPKAMVRLGEEKLGGYIRTIGLWRAKAHNVIALSQQLIDLHGGDVPDRDALEALPGVGRKTANVVLMEIFNEPTIAVRYACVPRFKPHGPGARSQSAGRRNGAGENHAAGIQTRRASLADPARPLHLRGAHAEMSELRDRRYLHLPCKDETAAAQDATRRANASVTHCSSDGRSAR